MHVIIEAAIVCVLRNFVLKNFTKFLEKPLCWSLFFNKVAGLATLLKREVRSRSCPVKFVKTLNTFFIEHLRWLLLQLVISNW